MDLSPFAGINPCGHKGLEVTSVQQELGADQPINFSDIGERLLHHLGQVLPSQT
jgi:lipoate-protein ligase B